MLQGAPRPRGTPRSPASCHRALRVGSLRAGENSSLRSSNRLARFSSASRSTHSTGLCPQAQGRFSGNSSLDVILSSRVSLCSTLATVPPRWRALSWNSSLDVCCRLASRFARLLRRSRREHRDLAATRLLLSSRVSLCSTLATVVLRLARPRRYASVVVVSRLASRVSLCSTLATVPPTRSRALRWHCVGSVRRLPGGCQNAGTIAV